MGHEPATAEREIDRFLGRVSDRRPHWNVKGREVFLHKDGRLRYAASVYEHGFDGENRLAPQIVLTVRDCDADKMRVLLRAVAKYGSTTYAKPLNPTTAQIGLVSEPLPFGLRSRAVDWVEHTFKRLRPVINATLGTPEKRTSAPGNAAQAGDQAPRAPRPKKACPVCHQPLPSGYTRHQRCENPRLAITDPGPAVPAHRNRYQELVARIEQREVPGHRAQRTSSVPVRRQSAKEAVLERCGGRCESPECSGMPTDVTDTGKPILEVDHVRPIAEEGRDHPEQMVALCPNCHAVKTRGSTRHKLQQTLLEIARKAHQAAMAG
ncbi:HNH endonuclease [Streptomyces sp. NPDC048331]|uniref:HNH endonuclease n=1 Tax=Streptomyces sp. NPDC048331 TaxID=3365534 RepID=UPI003712E87E